MRSFSTFEAQTTYFQSVMSAKIARRYVAVRALTQSHAGTQVTYELACRIKAQFPDAVLPVSADPGCEKMGLRRSNGVMAPHGAESGCDPYPFHEPGHYVTSENFYEYLYAGEEDFEDLVRLRSLCMHMTDLTFHPAQSSVPAVIRSSSRTKGWTRLHNVWQLESIRPAIR